MQTPSAASDTMRRSASSASLASGKNISPLYHNPKDHYDEVRSEFGR